MNELYINAEEVYGKEAIDKLIQKIYNIGMCIMFDTYLSDEECDYFFKKMKILK